jgi:hypothetical protein
MKLFGGFGFGMNFVGLGVNLMLGGMARGMCGKCRSRGEHEANSKGYRNNLFHCRYHLSIVDLLSLQL